MVNFKFEIQVSVELTKGKLATREELAEVLLDELEAAEPSNFLQGIDDGQYAVVKWLVKEK